MPDVIIELITSRTGKVHWWYGKEGYTWCGLDLFKYDISSGTNNNLTCKQCIKRIG